MSSIKKNIVITGATGSIGRRLVQTLTARGDDVVVFTRLIKKAEDKISNATRFVKWDYDKPHEWKQYLNGVDAIIHLAGANLSGRRWNNDYKKLAYDSRIISTRNLVEAIKSVEQKPKVFIASSAVGIYGDRYDEFLDEKSSLGNDFLANLCKDWENEAAKAEEIGVRRVSIRTGLVLAKDEGLLKQLYLPFKLFVGGTLAGGRQWFPWIHIDDIIGIYLQAIENDNLSGAVNGTSPGIVRMKEFAKTFGYIIHRPSIFPIPKLAMKVIAGEVAEYAVMSQRTSAEKIIDSGYKFKFENLERALRDSYN